MEILANTISFPLVLLWNFYQFSLLILLVFPTVMIMVLLPVFHLFSLEIHGSCGVITAKLQLLPAQPWRKAAQPWRKRGDGGGAPAGSLQLVVDLVGGLWNKMRLYMLIMRFYSSWSWHVWCVSLEGDQSRCFVVGYDVLYITALSKADCKQ